MKKAILLVAVAIFGFGNSGFSQETHHVKQVQRFVVTPTMFADSATKYINTQTENDGGFFKVKDPKTNKTLDLKLIKVHRDQLYRQIDGSYFSCADFKGPDGKVYDIDISLKPNQNHDLEPDKAPIVHKINGKARFTWYKDEGTWHRDTTNTYKGNEHPGH